VTCIFTYLDVYCISVHDYILSRCAYISSKPVSMYFINNMPAYKCVYMSVCVGISVNLCVCVLMCITFFL